MKLLTYKKNDNIVKNIALLVANGSILIVVELFIYHGSDEALKFYGKGKSYPYNIPHMFFGSALVRWGSYLLFANASIWSIAFLKGKLQYLSLLFSVSSALLVFGIFYSGVFTLGNAF